MLTLNNFERSPSGLKLDYTVAHTTPGRHGTTLTAPLVLYIQADKTRCEMTLTNCEGANAKEALDRMVHWLRRLADGIDQRQTLEIPV